MSDELQKIDDMEGLVELPLFQMDNLITNTKLLNQIYKVAKCYGNSQMVPRDYQGKPDNCFVACEIASRMNLSPIVVMQNLYVVQGRPCWSGQMCAALVNGSGKFDHDLEYVFVGEPGEDSHGCYAMTHKNGELMRSTTITIGMAKKEGWYGKNGSKWQSMPEQMMMYRAAAFFARVHCPNVLMGYSTDDEVRDIVKEPETTVVELDGDGDGSTGEHCEV